MNDSPSTSTGPAQQTGQAARHEASATADRTRAAAGEVAGSAREQAREVTDQAREQAHAVTTGVREHATHEAESQTHRAADTLRQWADDMADMADQARPGPARNLISQAADSGHRAAHTLDEHGIGGLAEQVQTFARRQPAMFLTGAAVTGFLIGRLAKANKNGQSGAARHERPEQPMYPEAESPPFTPDVTGMPEAPAPGGDGQRAREQGAIHSEQELPRYREVS